MERINATLLATLIAFQLWNSSVSGYSDKSIEDRESVSIVDGISNFFLAVRNIDVEYRYENVPDADAITYFRARRAITAGSNKNVTISDSQLKKMLDYFAPKWECHLATNFEQIDFQTQVTSSGVEKVSRHVYDGAYYFFQSESSPQWFVVPTLDAKVPLYSDILQFPVWSFGFSSLIPLDYADLPTLDILKAAEKRHKVFVSKKDAGNVVVRFAETRNDRSDKSVNAFELLCNVEIGFKLLKLSTFSVPKIDVDRLGSIIVNNEAMKTVSFEDHREVVPGVFLPFVVKASNRVRLSSLSDFLPTESYDFKGVGLDGFDPTRVLNVNTHTLTVKSLKANVSFADKMFSLENEKNSRVFNYMTGRYEDIKSLFRGESQK